MKIFVINLVRRTDRLVDIARDLRQHHLTFEVIEAVDAQDSPLAKAHHRLLLEFILGKRAYGIGPTSNYLSHRQIWQRMLDENIPAALILEDDARIIDLDKRFLNLDITQYGLDVLRLGANQAPLGLLPHTTTTGTKSILNRELVTGQLWGNVANIITLAAARKFLAHPRYWFPSDDYEQFKHCFGINYAIIDPLIWQPSGSASDVETTRKKLTFLQSLSLSIVKPLRRNAILPAIRTYLRFKTKHRGF